LLPLRERYGLFGSGEFLPWAEPVDKWLASSASGRDDRVLVVPTASAPEGDDVFWRWGSMGLSHYRKLGLEPAVVDLKVREDAFRPEVVAEVAGASLIFFSGGNPAHLARTLRGTPFWEAVTAAVGDGCALAGASAGIAFLGTLTFDPAAARGGSPERMWVPGLGWFRALFGPHWDAVERWRPGAQAMMLAAAPEDCAFLGIDEDTAVVGDGTHWEVRGRGTATVQPPGADPFVVGTGEQFDLPLRP
jgi:cyanophycinase